MLPAMIRVIFWISASSFFGSVSTRRRVDNSRMACDCCSVLGSRQTVISFSFVPARPDPINIAEHEAIPQSTESAERIWVEKPRKMWGLFFTRPKTRPHQPELIQECSILTRRKTCPDSILVRMTTDPESLTHQEIVERFRRLFDRDMTVGGFFLPESPGEDITSGEPQ